MSCNCNGCGQPQRLCRCPKGKGEAPKRAYIAECTDCDPCRPCESMVKICSFVTPTLTEGQRFRNSFVYNQEDDSVYYISDDGTPTRFGSSPMFIDNFNPDDRKIPRQTVFDFANQKAYIYDPEGNYVTVNLASTESDDEIHVYLPVSEECEESGNFVILDFGPHLERPEVTVKDSSGNIITPEDFIEMYPTLISKTIVVHVPQMVDVSGGQHTFMIPEQTLYLKPAIAGENSLLPSFWGTNTHTIMGTENWLRDDYGVDSELWILGVDDDAPENGFDAVFAVKGTESE